MLSVDVRMVNKDGGPVHKDTVIAPVNNIMGSLFSKTEVGLNKSVITPHPNSVYPDYINKLLSYGSDSKYSHLQSSGWYPDSEPFDPEPNMDKNTGFEARRKLFMDDADPPNRKYLTHWVNFCGPLHHDLKTCEVGIPPGIDIDVKLHFSDNNFRLMCADPDADAILEIGQINLHIPVGEMNETLYRRLYDKWGDKKMRLFHIRSMVTKFEIPMGSRNYSSNQIFKGIDTKPCRCFFFFLTNNQRYPRNFMTNPYKLVRKFMHPTTREWVYVETFDLKVGGHPMDSLGPNGTLNADTQGFLKFNMVNNTANSNRANGITYADWLDNSALYGFDMSSSGKCSNEFWIPSLLAGQVTINIQFSSELPHSVTLCCYQETPSLTTIERTGLVNHSFFSGTRG